MARTSFFVLAGLALRLLAQRWWQYALFCIGAFALQSACYFASPTTTMLILVQFVFPPLVTALTYAFVGHDQGLLTNPLQRALRRWWLVMLVDFIAGTGVSFGFDAFQLRDVFTGVALFAVAVSLVYADVYVVLEDPMDPLLLIRSIGRSTFMAWNGLDNIARSFVLTALQMFPFYPTTVLEQHFKAQHMHLASFWAQVPLGILLVPPLSALTALVYLDAAGRKAKRTCGE